MTPRGFLALACSTFLLASCGGDRTAGDPADLVLATFTDAFQVGDEPSEQQFTEITSMAFAPDGQLVVMDRGEATVTVLDPGGREVARWGNQGEGPGEFSGTRGKLAVSGTATVAVDDAGSVALFTVGGNLIDSYSLGALSVFDLGFDGEGDVLARTQSAEALLVDTREQVLRLKDQLVVWSSEPSTANRFQWFRPHVEFASLPDGRIAVGMSDQYDLVVLDASTGQELDHISRDIPLRGPSDEFADRFLGDMPELRGRVTLAETFPVISGVFTGPPGRAVWIRRGMGVGDPLAPPADDMDDWTFVLYDLFSGETYEYLGTVEIPPRLELMTGDATRVAGVQSGAMGEHSIRVLRVNFAEPFDIG
ncbi:MAG: hypothetical protein F4Y07_01270 [Gemmatimonadetes bacterium]|nr:hypothetical protein [Gemmatimonadota bacterium]